MVSSFEDPRLALVSECAKKIPDTWEKTPNPSLDKSDKFIRFSNETPSAGDHKNACSSSGFRRYQGCPLALQATHGL